MKYPIFILSLLSLIVAAVLLVIALSSYAPDAHAEIRPDWSQLYGTEELEVYLLGTDGRRLYAAGNGVYISLDNGDTWRLTDLHNANCRAIAIGPNRAYVGTAFGGVFRSDSHGVTWEPKNNGIERVVRRGGDELGPPIVEQILVTSSGTVIVVGYHTGTYISHNQGDTWHSVYDEWIYPGNKEHNTPDWHFGDSIWSMTEFDGYWWAAYSTSSALFRSPDKGATWELLPNAIPGNLYEYGRVTDWAVLDDRLYVAGREGFGRWNETHRVWDHLSQGLPTGYSNAPIRTLAVNSDRLFAGTASGVYMFDERSETFIPAGLQEFGVGDLASHQSDLYATAYAHGELSGIYRASIPVVHSYGKAATTWGAIKTE